MKVKQFWRDVRRGAGYLEHYGNHSGTPVVLFLIVMGIIAGGVRGGLIMAAIFGTIWVYGCAQRARDHDKILERLKKK